MKQALLRQIQARHTMVPLATAAFVAAVLVGLPGACEAAVFDTLTTKTNTLITEVTKWGLRLGVLFLVVGIIRIAAGGEGSLSRNKWGVIAPMVGIVLLKVVDQIVQFLDI